MSTDTTVMPRHGRRRAEGPASGPLTGITTAIIPSQRTSRLMATTGVLAVVLPTQLSATTAPDSLIPERREPVTTTQTQALTVPADAAGVSIDLTPLVEVDTSEHDAKVARDAAAAEATRQAAEAAELEELRASRARAAARPSRDAEHAAPPAPAATGDVLGIARQYVGIRYTWGGKTPEGGLDCSGFVNHVYQQLGVTKLNGNAHHQAKQGTRINESDVRPGDLVAFYDGSGHVFHIGFALGGGKMLDAPKPGKSIGEHTIWSDQVFFIRP